MLLLLLVAIGCCSAGRFFRHGLITFGRFANNDITPSPSCGDDLWQLAKCYSMEISLSTNGSLERRAELGSPFNQPGSNQLLSSTLDGATVGVGVGVAGAAVGVAAGRETNMASFLWAANSAEGMSGGSGRADGEGRPGRGEGFCQPGPQQQQKGCALQPALQSRETNPFYTCE